ncbi:MAG: TPM domain-containing protein [Chryseosolibacter sp.]
MIKRGLYISILLVILFYFGSCERPSKQLWNDSKIEDRVIDSAELLSSTQEENLFKLIEELEKSVGSQIAVVIINTLHGQDINQYSIQKSEDLSLGRDLYNDGVLITVAYQDRKTRIEVGYGLEKILKDEVTAQIIREQMLPKFREQKVYEGIYESVSAIKKLVEENKKLVGQKP